MSRNKTRGFTLIELLVVIAIIMILMGLFLPVLSKAQLHARKTRAKSEVNQLVTVWKQYRMDYRGFPPGIGQMDGGAVNILMGQNPLRIKYMELKQGIPFADPWGSVYRVEMDINSDNIVNPGGELVYADVVAWSDGPDGNPGTGDEIKSWQ